ncbi:heptose II phosphotransferase [Hypnocyclicus thermotrophus]|uniref:Heptose II phosphotransferase n=1 Tax=Hypnocyclicus thermotrophus TaxID=1627895 RepID=A0AA46I5S6_9FUSO|nr:hypothetical protein [Hypnocyclicus thermotrophus]TDT70613.1 heptose II phosphotransferase [Hypnocyclicus thermotrophus]
MENYKIKIYNFTEKKYTIEELEKIYNIKGKVLKDSTRSIVKLLTYDNKNLILKIPVEKNKRKWIRFLTLFRKSEVLKNLKSMEILLENGIKTNIPIACVEYKKFGMVFNSYMIYEFMEGEVVGKEDAKEVIELLKKIHSLGYLHNDTQKRNFLKNKKEIITIDTSLKKKNIFISKILENIEYIKFSVDISEAYNYIETDKISFKLAKFFYEVFKLKRKISKIIKKTINKLINK